MHDTLSLRCRRSGTKFILRLRLVFTKCRRLQRVLHTTAASWESYDRYILKKQSSTMSDLIHIVTEEDEAQCLPVSTHIKRHFQLSSRLRGRIKREKLVYLNGEKVDGYIIPSAGDEIKICMPEESSYFPPEDIPYDVVFEDNDLLVINKPAGYVVHPTHGMPEHTIANGISKRMIDSGDKFKIRFVNRLDMDTSGLLVVAKNSFVQDSYTRQQKADQVKKEYIAVCYGLIADDFGTIDAPIGRPDPAKPFRGVTEDGKPSVTHFEVLERFCPPGSFYDNITDSMSESNYPFPKGFSVVRLRLETGRTHQIRVHMMHIGHTLVGDEFYGGECLPLIKRQALHASDLSFIHPLTEKRLDLHAPLPEDIQQLLSLIQ